ncbi:Hypothetical predicted protein [Olea europaea subsp. europaea]|uniref:Uncharacterized protein n=1 Tax=Olea europaea subsp. europaea TaxID=158383 RepID=A0A8S0UJL3_OLEEU|nr:Hypothetical predicted protein [Olea europaea subsp. europaea]
MYSREKQLREGTPRNSPGNPSFSSTLLDKIINSIDGTDEKSEDSKVHKEKPTKKHGVGRVKTGGKENEEMGILWREREINEKIIARRRAELENLWIQENDLMFFSSNSSSSDSSGALSSSDSEFFGGSNSTKSKISCFSAPKLKPVRTSGGVENHFFHSQNEEFLYLKKQENKVDDNLIKSKSRAMKIYANLNKMKQPISPGVRLTNFINSLFANSKKSNPNGGFDDSKKERKSKSQQDSSTCSSASSFSRSCLINNSSKPAEKIGIGNRRTVRFHPANVIVDEDSNSLPRGHTSGKKHDVSDKFGRPPLAPDFRLSPGEKNRRIRDSSKVYPNQRKDDFSMSRNIRYENEDDEEEDNEDAASDSSSELFELDHLALFGNMKKFSEELPVYENTHFDTNHVIASGLIRKL